MKRQQTFLKNNKISAIEKMYLKIVLPKVIEGRSH